MRKGKEKDERDTGRGESCERMPGVGKVRGLLEKHQQGNTGLWERRGMAWRRPEWRHQL